MGTLIVRCGDCAKFDRNPQVLPANAPPGTPMPDPNIGHCRAKLPVTMAYMMEGNRPASFSHQPVMEATSGCCEGVSMYSVGAGERQ